MTELTNSSSELTFGQPIRGDTADARKEIRMLISCLSNVRLLSAGLVGKQIRLSKKDSVMIYGTETEELLDFVAVCNLIFTKFGEKLS